MISGADIMLCRDYRGQFIGGWTVTEKLNGCFAWWDGDGCREFFSREGNLIQTPEWFRRGLPSVTLTGEIHAERGTGIGNNNTGYKKSMTAVVQGIKWFTADIKFTCFDVPRAAGNWRERMAHCPSSLAIPYDTIRTGNDRNLAKVMKAFFDMGSEGAVFRHPDAEYQPGRCENLLRWKFHP